MDLARAITAPGSESRSVRTGIVAAHVPGESVITVTLDGADVVMPCLESVTAYAVGDTVVCLADGKSGQWCLGRLGTAVDPPPAVTTTDPVIEPGKQAVNHRRTLLPVSTGTYRGGGWRTDTGQLIQGDSGGFGLNTGAAFYGDQFAALHVDMTRPYSATVTYRRGRGGVFAAVTPAFRLVTERTRPAGAPTLNETAAGTPVPVGGVVSWPIPAAWLALLVDGDRGGLAVTLATSDPYARFDGLGEYAAAFAVAVNYWG